MEYGLGAKSAVSISTATTNEVIGNMFIGMR